MLLLLVYTFTFVSEVQFMPRYWCISEHWFVTDVSVLMSHWVCFRCWRLQENANDTSDVWRCAAEARQKSNRNTKSRQCATPRQRVNNNTCNIVYHSISIVYQRVYIITHKIQRVHAFNPVHCTISLLITENVQSITTCIKIHFVDFSQQDSEVAANK